MMKEIELDLNRQKDFFLASLGQILDEWIKHDGEKGYVQAWTNGNYELSHLEWIPEKNINKDKFIKMDLFDVLPNTTHIGELLFEVLWQENFSKGFIRCDYFIDMNKRPLNN